LREKADRWTHRSADRARAFGARGARAGPRGPGGETRQHAAPRGWIGRARARSRGGVLSPALSRERNGPRSARAPRWRSAPALYFSHAADGRRAALPDGIRALPRRSRGPDRGPALRQAAARGACRTRRRIRLRDAARGRGDIPAAPREGPREAPHAWRALRNSARD